MPKTTENLTGYRLCINSPSAFTVKSILYGIALVPSRIAAIAGTSRSMPSYRHNSNLKNALFTISSHKRALSCQVVHYSSFKLGTEIEMLDETSSMPEYQWKLTIVERNLVPSNWIDLIPEAQEQTLWEADDLIGDLPLSHRLRVLTSLETLQEHLEEEWKQKVQQLLSNHPSVDIRQALELNFENTTFTTAVLDSSVLVESI